MPLGESCYPPPHIQMGRRFGQHFLAKGSTLHAIAMAACEPETPLAIEIGPGRGALTEHLLQRVVRLIAIEVDPVLVHYLRQKFRDALAEGRLELIESDVLSVDLASLTSGRPVPITGNLPYYITSPILERVFRAQNAWNPGVFLVQAEVAERLAAGPGSRDYGYLSVTAQVQANVQMLFEVPRTAFRPPPKVDSAVVKLTPRDAFKDFHIADRQKFLKFAGLCFRQKRKTLRNNLSALYRREQLEDLIEPKQRAEQMTISELAMLFREIQERGIVPAGTSK